MVRASCEYPRPLRNWAKCQIDQLVYYNVHQQIAGRIHLHVMPSALMSCILQHAETIRMANLSTTNIRQSTLFDPGLPLNRITSFIISKMKNKRKHDNKMNYCVVKNSPNGATR